MIGLDRLRALAGLREAEELPKTFNNGGYLRTDFWYRPKTGEIIDASHHNHAETVVRDFQKFGISREEWIALRQSEDFDKDDWNEPTIRLANAHGWVRVKAEGRAESRDLCLQSTDRRALHATAKRFVPEFSPVNLFLDSDIHSYATVWHERLAGNRIDLYLKTGRIPSTLTEALVEEPGGFWIDEVGEFLECDHRHDWHHAQIALDRFPPEDEDDLDPDDDGGDGAIYAAYAEGWIRGSYYGTSLAVGWRVTPSRAAARTLIGWLRGRAGFFTTVHVSGEDQSADFTDTKSAIRFIGSLIARR